MHEVNIDRSARGLHILATVRLLAARLRALVLVDKAVIAPAASTADE